MLIAQALGEYVAVSALVSVFNDASTRLEEIAGEWGLEGLIALIVAAFVWMVVTRNKRL